jgi:protein-tyrosine phosphatase
VPFISKITDDLWQGGCTIGLILPTEVKHVVSLYAWEQYVVRHPLSSSLTVRMYDDLESGVGHEQVLAIARWVNLCRKTGVTLVHCQAGLNRSALISATALVLDGMSPPGAIELLRAKRSPAVLCNPSFVDQIMALDDPL